MWISYAMPPNQIGEIVFYATAITKSFPIRSRIHFHLKTRKTYLIPEYIYFSNDYWSLLLEMWLQIPLYKVDGKKPSSLTPRSKIKLLLLVML